MGDATNYETATKPSEGRSYGSVCLIHAASKCGACVHELCHLNVLATPSKRTAFNQHVENASPIGVIHK